MENSLHHILHGFHYQRKKKRLKNQKIYRKVRIKEIVEDKKNKVKQRKNKKKSKMNPKNKNIAKKK